MSAPGLLVIIQTSRLPWNKNVLLKVLQMKHQHLQSHYVLWRMIIKYNIQKTDTDAQYQRESNLNKFSLSGPLNTH